MQGGKREGAGRKPSQIKKKSVTFKILPEWEKPMRELFKQLKAQTK